MCTTLDSKFRKTLTSTEYSKRHPSLGAHAHTSGGPLSPLALPGCVWVPSQAQRAELLSKTPIGGQLALLDTSEGF